MRLNLPMLLAAVTLFAIEVIIATQLNHYQFIHFYPLYHFIRAYFGDFLVVILVYCAVKAFWNVEATRLAIGVFAFAVAVELAQLLRLADVLQLTGWARVVVGTSFSFHDVWMYAAGCFVVWWVDTKTVQHHHDD